MSDDEPLPPKGRGKVERKQYLLKQKLIHCGYCPINRGENSYGKRRPIDDRTPKAVCPECGKGKILKRKGYRKPSGVCSNCKQWVTTSKRQRRKWVIYL